MAFYVHLLHVKSLILKVVHDRTVYEFVITFVLFRQTQNYNVQTEICICSFTCICIFLLSHYEKIKVDFFIGVN
jgi:hypothetical protein